LLIRHSKYSAQSYTFVFPLTTQEISVFNVSYPEQLSTEPTDI